VSSAASIAARRLARDPWPADAHARFEVAPKTENVAVAAFDGDAVGKMRDDAATIIGSKVAAASRAGCEPNESVRRLRFFALRGLRRETGIHFRCNPLYARRSGRPARAP
jgi:hypothetical protein